MTQQFTASEVRDSAIAVVARDMEYEAEMLRAFADLLEAQEIARNDAIEREYERENNPAPSDAERLAEALRKIAREPMKPWPDPFAHSHEAFGRAVHATWCDMNRIARDALAAHSAQAQPPAARVPGVSAQAHEKAQAALAAQENPNG